MIHMFKEPSFNNERKVQKSKEHSHSSVSVRATGLVPPMVGHAHDDILLSAGFRKLDEEGRKEHDEWSYAFE